MKSFSVLGAGAWGTALAFQLARINPKDSILLWGHNPDHQLELQQQHCNPFYFPDDVFPTNLTAVIDLPDAVKNSDGIIIAVPSHSFKELIQQLDLLCSSGLPMLSATKGLDPSTGNFLSTLVKENQNFAILSGPSFASEVIAGLPTAITIAATNPAYAEFWQKHLHNDYFRVYTTDDVIGVQIGGTVKNVLAIATGIADGLGFGANARAALITRGLAEMIRLNNTLGGKQATLMGLAGVGDLVLTCTDNQSRNRRFGIALGKGKSVAQAQEEVRQVVEGHYAAKLLHEFALKHQVELPLCTAIYQILYEQHPVKEVISALLARSPKEE